MELVITNRKNERFVVLYDEQDHELIQKHTWYIGQGYVRTMIAQRVCILHRMILGLDDNKILGDHINHDKLDNRRSNLRECTFTENVRNRRASGSSKYLGVSIKICKFKEFRYPYIISRIRVNKKLYYLGSFKTEEAAAKEYDKHAKIHFGEFANLNFKD